MHEPALGTSADTLLFAIPFIGLLLVGIFRLDEVFASPKATVKPRRAPCGVDEDGEPVLSDPDGRLWGSPRLRK